MSSSLVIRRIFGVEPKNRVRVHTYIERELMQVIQDKKMEIATTMNLALECYLIHKGIIKPDQETRNIPEPSFKDLMRTI